MTDGGDGSEARVLVFPGPCTSDPRRVTPAPEPDSGSPSRHPDGSAPVREQALPPRRAYSPTRLWRPGTAPWVATLDEALIGLVTSGAPFERWRFHGAGIDRRFARLVAPGRWGLTAVLYPQPQVAMAFRELQRHLVTVPDTQDGRHLLDVSWGGARRRYLVVLEEEPDPRRLTFPVGLVLRPLGVVSR